MKSERVPHDLIRSLQNVAGFNEEAFVEAHDNPSQVVSVRINSQKITNPEALFPVFEKVPWSSNGYYLPERPAFIFDPMLHGGAYYVQEASGMFIEQCLKQTVDLTSNIKALDLCAAPGGKSTLIQSLISSESLLICNEVIKSRAAVLLENIMKWGGSNVMVTNNDPRDFNRLPDFFDVMMVDAPCSGSGLFRRDRDAIEEWSPDAVQICSLRQQRILSDAYTCLKQNGILIYSTCSYSPEENEQIGDWLMLNHDVESIKIETFPGWNIVETQSQRYKVYGYRFFPDRVKGEGFYVSCFRKKDGNEEEIFRPKKSVIEKATSAEKLLAATWIKTDGPQNFYRFKDEIFVLPASLGNDLSRIQLNLHLKKAGVTVGKPVKDEMLPDHHLAVSGIVNNELPTISLKKDEALQYLRKEEVTLSGTQKGWALVNYNGLYLGWVKILANRVNNYYPKEWRILKSGNS